MDYLSDSYKTLEVSPHASNSEIEESYRKLLERWQSPPFYPNLTPKKIEQIEQAYTKITTHRAEDYIGKKCPECGYERRRIDDLHGIVPSTECPRCGVIYNKVKSPFKVERGAHPSKVNSHKLSPSTSSVQRRLSTEEMIDDVESVWNKMSGRQKAFHILIKFPLLYLLVVIVGGGACALIYHILTVTGIGSAILMFLSVYVVWWAALKIYGKIYDESD